jgi:hypothetical protein
VRMHSACLFVHINRHASLHTESVFSLLWIKTIYLSDLLCLSGQWKNLDQLKCH